MLLFDAGVLTPGFLEALARHGLAFFCLDYQQLMARGHVEIDLSRPRDARLTLARASLALRDVSHVIWTLPPGMDMTFGARTLARETERHQHERIRIARWTQLLRDLEALLPRDARWFPGPPLVAGNAWQNRLGELGTAQRIGLRIPETICTNDVKAARAFVKRHRGRVCLREFNRAAGGALTTPLDADAIKRLDLIETAPTVLQRYVDKAYELRVVLIGDRTFACRIDSQASPRARWDWRVYDNASVKWEPTTLPASLRRRLVRFARAHRLSWGSFDLIRSTTGEYVFLEMNRPGSQYWLKPFTGLDVTEEMARLIAGKPPAWPSTNARTKARP